MIRVYISKGFTRQQGSTAYASLSDHDRVVTLSSCHLRVFEGDYLKRTSRWHMVPGQLDLQCIKCYQAKQTVILIYYCLKC